MGVKNYKVRIFYLQILRFLRLIRYVNLLIIIASQYLVAIFLVGPSSKWKHYITDPHLFLLSISTVLIAAAGYIINDYYDIKIDIINKPRRVVVGKFLRRRVAMTIHTIFNVAGIGLGLILSYKVAIINLFCAFWLWLYSNQLKRLPLVGNLSVALLTALSISIVGIYFDKNIFLVNAYAVFAFFISLIREIIKDMEDVRGDEQFGCRTLPIVWGMREVKWFIYGLMILFVIVIFCISLNLNNSHLNLYFLTMTLPFIYLLNRLIKADKRRDFKFLSNLCKAIMIIGIASMIFI